MNEKKRVLSYLVIVFVLTYAIEISVCLLVPQFYSFAAGAAMFIPALSALIVCRGLSKERAGILWKPEIKKSIGWFLLAWFFPVILTALCGAFYFLIFPSTFSKDIPGFISALEQQGVQITDGTIQGVPISMMFLIQVISAVIFAPFINAVLAIGEEIGWRGFLTPSLERLLGRRPALIVSGVIWGIWHAPLIVLIGYEYGTGYFGEPWLGVIAFAYITTLLGILLSFIYDKSRSILAPALFHGAFNACASLPVFFMKGEINDLLLGPAPIGLIASVPFLIIAAAVFVLHKGSVPAEEESVTAEETTDSV